MHNVDSRTSSGAAVSELILAVFRLNGRLLVAGDRLVAPLGLTSARWQVLGAVALSPTPETVARLARNMGLNRQGVQRIVGDLVQEGLMVLCDNPHHKKAKLVKMTPQGASIYRAALAVQTPWVNSLGQALAVEDIECAGHLLDELRRRLEALGDLAG